MESINENTRKEISEVFGNSGFKLKLGFDFDFTAHHLIINTFYLTFENGHTPVYRV